MVSNSSHRPRHGIVQFHSIRIAQVSIYIFLSFFSSSDLMFLIHRARALGSISLKHLNLVKRVRQKKRIGRIASSRKNIYHGAVGEGGEEIYATY